MYGKYQKNQDSLVALQRDINILGFQKYTQAKKAKMKADKEKADKQKQNYSRNNSSINERLPSLYQKNGIQVKKFGSLHGDPSHSLMQRIREFENRINDLQTQNAIQKKQNQKLIEHVATIKNGGKLNQSYRNRESPQQQFYPQFAPQYPFLPYMSPMMPFQNMGPYPPQMGPFQNQSAHQAGKKQKTPLSKMKLLSKFRIAGYVVFFAIFFRKYSKSFTLNRFDLFKETWCGWDSANQSKQALCDYFRQQISLQVFQNTEINELDSLRNLDEEPKKKKKKSVKSEESESNSADSSDLQSQQSSKKDPLKQGGKRRQSKVFQFYLKIDIAVSFVIQFIREICKVVENGQFQEKNSFLSLFLPRQFQIDHLHEEQDLKYLNLHSEKGYSQNEKAFTQYLLIKNIYLSTFVEYSLINEFGKRFYIDKNKKSNKNYENRVFFSFHIRTSIFKLMIQNYLVKKLQKIKECPLPKEELRPFTRQLFSDSFYQKRILSFKNNGIDMDQQNILEISQEEMKKKEHELKTILDEVASGLMKKLFAYRKSKYYQVLKEKTLSEKYRTQDNNYFKLHDKQDIINERQRKALKKETKSPFLDSTPTISSGNISIVRRLQKPEKKGAKKGKTQKNKNKKKQSSQSQELQN